MNYLQKLSRVNVTRAMILLLTVAAGSDCFAAGLLKPVGNHDQDSISIKSHKVDVVINNGFARTEVDQVFENTGDIDLEATYSHPLPKQASLSEVSLWIDGQEVIGEVLEKECACQAYQNQKASGNDTALAQKNDFMSFQVSVSPVRAGQSTRVRMVYYQPIEIDANIGRYTYPLEEGNTDDESIGFWSTDTEVKEAFNFNLTLKSAFPVADVRMPGNMDKAIITAGGTPASGNVDDAGQPVESASSPTTTPQSVPSGQFEYNARIDNQGQMSLTQDIVFYYKLAEDVPARIELIPYRQDKNSEGTFMAVITPAADLQPITNGTDWVFILDKSGSMSGEKIQTLARGVSKSLGKFKADDRYRIIAFSDNAHDITKGYLSANDQNVKNSIDQVNALTADGGTNIYDALVMGYGKVDADRTTNVILVTDGVANVGETQHKAFIALLRKYDIRLFTFVIGNGANQPLMDRLAEVSGGFAMNISSNDDIAGRVMQAKNKAAYQNMRNVVLTFKGEKVRELTPAKPASLYRGQQLVVLGKYTGTGPAEMELTANIGGQDKSWKCNVMFPEQDTDNPELERIWALSKIDGYMQDIRDFGEDETLRGKVVSLGEEYSLVTDYTSMLVMSDSEFEKQGIDRKNANRTQKERLAQQQKATQPAKNYRVDNNTSNGNNSGGSFNGSPAPGLGGGPVGPALLALMFWNKRRQSKVNKK